MSGTVRSDLVGEAGVGTVGVVPQLGVLGVVTPGVTGSVVRIISMIICTWDCRLQTAVRSELLEMELGNGLLMIMISYCLLARSGLVRVPSPANVASTVAGCTSHCSDSSNSYSFNQF